MVQVEARSTDIHVRVPGELYDKVKVLADAEQRSVNWMFLELARMGEREKTRIRKRRQVEPISG